MLGLLSRPLLYAALAGVVLAVVAGVFFKIKELGRLEEHARNLQAAIDRSREGRRIHAAPINDRNAWLLPREDSRR